MFLSGLYLRPNCRDTSSIPVPLIPIKKMEGFSCHWHRKAQTVIKTLSEALTLPHALENEFLLLRLFQLERYLFTSCTFDAHTKNGGVQFSLALKSTNSDKNIVCSSDPFSLSWKWFFAFDGAPIGEISHHFLSWQEFWLNPSIGPMDGKKNLTEVSTPSLFYRKEMKSCDWM